ncbi:MAG: hypothetical protein KFF46_09765 [Desulfobacterales bacterium]|nr:hypothetical protein [Desulfobacterales bacterium]
MGKRGPTPKAKAELRRHPITCRLTDVELDRLDRGRPEKMTRGEWLRTKALKRKLPRQIPELNREAWTTLSTAVSNVNQLSKSINQGTRSELAAADLADLIAQIQAVRLQLLRGDVE